MASFKDRLNEALSIRGMKASELSKLSGISEGSISQYRKGHFKASQVNLELLAKTLNVQIAWLMGADVPMNKEYTADSNIFNHPDILPIKKKKFPLIGGIACGEPVYQEEDYETSIIANGDINADFAMRCYGDSMINIGIKDGYIVFIRKQPKVENGEVAAVNIDGEFTLKRFYDYGNIIVLRSENPAPEYKDLEYRENDANNIIILGKAVAFQGDIK